MVGAGALKEPTRPDWAQDPWKEDAAAVVAVVPRGPWPGRRLAHPASAEDTAGLIGGGGICSGGMHTAMPALPLPRGLAAGPAAFVGEHVQPTAGIDCCGFGS